MERVTVSYLRKVWDKEDWLFEGQRGFRPGYSCESQVIMVCQDTADSVDNGGKLDAIVIDLRRLSIWFPMIGSLRKLRPREWTRG
jgi:hypothetical protein